jgi:hypothetical protein
MQRPPAFQFHVRDYRASRSVQRMTYAQRGMYVEMLCEQWDKDSLPDCPRACADLMGGTEDEWIAAWPILRRNFVDRRNRPRRDNENPVPTDHNAARKIVNLRLESYRRSLRSFKKDKQIAGKKGGHAKALKDKALLAGTAIAKPSIDLAKPSSGSGSGSGSGSSSGSQTALTVPADRGSKRPVYTSDRFAVFEWQLDELSKMLGAHFEDFDIHGFFDGLTQRSRTDGLVIPRAEVWPWLQAQVLAEVKRRNLPTASSAAPVRDRAAEERAQNERVLALVQESRRAGR